MDLSLVTYPKHAGRQSTVLDHLVTRVPYGTDGDIVYVKFTQDYRSHNSRPFKLVKSGRQFKTLDAAVEALIKERS